MPSDRSFVSLLGLATAGAMLALAGCSASPPRPTDPLTLRGSLDWPGRDRLPPDSRSIVELREADRPDGRVVADLARPIVVPQGPVPFELRVDRARLEPGRRYAVRAGVTVDGRPAWQSAAAPVDGSAAGPVEVGALRMSPVRPIAFASTLDCGGRIATLGASDNRWVLRVDGRDIPLKQAVSASGARWIGADDPSVEVWNRGERTRVTVDGREWPECRAAQPAAGSLRGPESFVARGNEPSWRLDVTAARIRFVPGMDGPAVEAPTPPAQPAGAGRRWVADAGGRPLAVVALDRVCTDSMSGMPHPLTVTVEHGGRTWNGCGGEPASLLRGPEWVVEDLDGRGIVDRSRATLAFLPDGRIAGRASCNDYAGRWKLDGERLTIADIGTTTKSCAPALANQERRFLDRLRGVAGFEIRPDGALRLRGPSPADGDGTILARR